MELKSPIKRTLTYMRCALILSLIFLSISNMSQFVHAQEEIYFSSSDILNDAHIEDSINRIMEHVISLSNMGSRVTGYPGYYLAADYIAEKFNEYGLLTADEYGLAPNASHEGYFWYFNVTSPIDRGTSITILPNGTVLKAYTLWPNLFQTSRCQNLTGILLYGGTGTLQELSDAAKKHNTTIEGSIVLLDFNSLDNWKNAYKFGAKAVIYLEPFWSSRIQSETKFITVPIHFPKVYLPRTPESEALLEAAKNKNIQVSITSNMTYDFIDPPARNIIGFIKGKEMPNEIIVLEAYYDCFSVVPALAPGADEAVSIATLLEMARYYSKPENQPSRTIMFLASSSHWQALAGPREFVETFFFSDCFNWTSDHNIPNYDQGEKAIAVMWSLSLSTDSAYIATPVWGDFYLSRASTGFITARYDPINLLIKKTLGAIKNQLGIELRSQYGGVVEVWGKGRFPTYYMIDCEPFQIAGGIGIAFQTSRNYMLHWGTPFNTIDKVNRSNLKQQLIFIYAVFHQTVNLPELFKSSYWKFVKPLRRLTGMTGYGTGFGGVGFLTVLGDVVYYDALTGVYANKDILKPDLEVFVDLYFVGLHTTLAQYNPFAHVITKPDELGRYEVHGVPADVLNTWGAGGWGGTNNKATVVAYVLNKTTGELLYAPDLGTYGNQVWNFVSFYADEVPKYKRTVVFNCGTLVLTDIMNPITKDTPRTNYLLRNNIFIPYISITILDFNSHSEPLFWGTTWITAGSGEPIQMVFVQPDTPIEVLIYRTNPDAPEGTLPNIVAGILINGNETYPEGLGYSIKSGETKRILFSPLQFLKNLYYLDRARLEKSLSFNIRSIPAEQFANKSDLFLQYALQSLVEKEYYQAYVNALNGWAWESLCYVEVKNILVDVTNTSTFFSALLIPFAFLLERLIFDIPDRRRILAIIGILFFCIFILYLSHPGFHLASNIPAVLLAFVVEIMSIPVLLLIINETGKTLKEIRAKMIGEHFAEISRISAIMLSFSTGIRNMRRRKLRTLLTLSTIVIVMFALASLTSLSLISFPRGVTSSWTYETWPYNGWLIAPIMTSTQVKIISDNLLETIRCAAGSNVVVARAWLFPPQATDQERGEWSLTSSNGSYRIWALAGMDPKERELYVDIDGYMDEGSWFIEGELYSAVITDTIAEALNVHVGDYITFSGQTLLVRGILNSECSRLLMGLDGISIAPIDIQQMQLKGEVQTPGGSVTIRIPWNRLLIVPFDLARNVFGAPVYTVAVGYGENEPNFEAARELVMSSKGWIQIWAGYERMGSDTEPIREVTTYYKAEGVNVIGMEQLIVPMAIALLIQLTTLLGSIQERTREITTFSTIGLSPLHVAGIFLAETFTYAILGAVIGYMCGLVGMNVLLNLHLLHPEFVPNFTTTFVTVAIFLSIAVIMIASIYPTYRASKLVTPSLERKWKITTKPIGDTWSIPLPFRVSNEEIMGLLSFIKEFFDAHKMAKAGNFEIRDVQYREKKTEGTLVKIIDAIAHLPPYDAGIIQNASIEAIYDKETKDYGIVIVLRRTSGPLGNWQRSNVKFINTIRKQFLIWRSLPPKSREDYIKSWREKIHE